MKALLKSKILPKENQQNFYLLAVLASLLFTVFSLFVFPGYHTEREDQKFYIAPIFQKAVPDAYQRDFLMEKTQTTASFFDELVGFFLFGNPENLYISLFWFTFFSQILFFLGIIFIALALSKNQVFSLFIPAIFIIGHQGFICNALPPGSWFFSYGTELHARSLTISFSVFSFGLYLIKNQFLAWITISIGILMHIISALPIALVMGIHSLFIEIYKEKKYIKIYYYLAPITAVILIFLSMSGDGNSMSLFAEISPKWMGFLEERVGWVFLWSHYSSLNILLTIYLPLTFFYFIFIQNQFSKKDEKMLIHISFFSIILLIGIGIIGFDFFHLPLFGQLQLYRSIFYLQIILSLALLSTCYTEYKNSIKWRKKILWATPFFFVPFGGQLFFIPLSLVLLATILLQGKGIFQKKIVRLFLLMIIIGATLGMIFFSAETNSQITNIKSFLTGIIHDPLLSLGFLFLWIENTLPLFFLLWITTSIKENTSVIKKKTIIFSAVIIISLFISLLLTNKYRVFTDSPLHKINTFDNWILKNIQNNELIFTTNQAEGKSIHIRNHLGKSIFSTQIEGGQGTFNQNYALEWQHRRKIQSAPNEHWDELTEKYKIDYIIAKKEEEISKGTEVFSGDKYIIYRVEK